MTSMFFISREYDPMNNPPQDLEGQFLFVQETTFIPPLWVQHERLGWILASHPNLPISELCLPNDHCVGWIVGHPVTAEALSPLRIRGNTNIRAASRKGANSWLSSTLHSLTAHVLSDIENSTCSMHYQICPTLSRSPEMSDNADVQQ